MNILGCELGVRVGVRAKGKGPDLLLCRGRGQGSPDSD